MSATTYKSVHLAKRPKDRIIPGETFNLKSHDAPKESDLKDGEVLFQSLYLSLDPAMRGWLNGERTSVQLCQFSNGLESILPDFLRFLCHVLHVMHSDSVLEDPFSTLLFLNLHCRHEIIHTTRPDRRGHARSRYWGRQSIEVRRFPRW